MFKKKCFDGKALILVFTMSVPKGRAVLEDGLPDLVVISQTSVL